MGNVTLETITQALARAIKNVLGENFCVYSSPTVQGDLPCVYITFIPTSGVKHNRVGHALRYIMVDLVYLSDFNLPNLDDEYSGVVDGFDNVFEFFSFTDTDDNTHILRTRDRTWNYDRSGLHYKFRLDLSYRRYKPVPYMQILEEPIIDAEEEPS
ncbi:MAG: hypothetical protein LBN43_00070 [Oscillospiraceae bacterium]|jgi:hypothetical protein|nr:hypothetical protein [Oscillospiraceae bacterium]